MSSPSVEVACFGELLWDFFEADAKPDSKEPIARQFRREIGGAAANVAVGLARLGVGASAVGAVGKDKLGQALRGALDAEGVEVGHVASIDAPTGLTFVLRDAAGVPSFLPYRRDAADTALDAAKVATASAKAAYVVVGSTSLLGGVRAATEKFLTAAAKAKATIVVDLNMRPALWPDADAMRAAAAELAGKAAIVKASETDLSALAGKRGMTWLEDHAKGATWILTRGENGAGAIGPHGQVVAPTKRVRCVDATGAGDAFLAGTLAVLARAGAKPSSGEWSDPKQWTRALEVGHAVAAKVVAAVGATAGLVGLEDLRARLRKR